MAGERPPVRRRLLADVPIPPRQAFLHEWQPKALGAVPGFSFYLHGPGALSGGAVLFSKAIEAHLPVDGTTNTGVLPVDIELPAPLDVKEHTLTLRWEETEDRFYMRIIRPIWTALSETYDDRWVDRVLATLRAQADEMILDIFDRRQAALAALGPSLLPNDDVLKFTLAPYISYGRKPRRASLSRP